MLLSQDSRDVRSGRYGELKETLRNPFPQGDVGEPLGKDKSFTVAKVLM